MLILPHLPAFTAKATGNSYYLCRVSRMTRPAQGYPEDGYVDQSLEKVIP